MRNVLAIAVVALTLGLSSTADAQNRGYNNRGGNVYNNNSVNVYNNYYRGGYRGGYGGGYWNGNNWVAPLVGGLVVGGVIGALAAQPNYYAAPPQVVYAQPPVVVQPQPYCRRRVIGYDWNNRPVVDNVCTYE